MSTNKSCSYGQNRQIAKSASVIAFATLCSRVLGFLRDIIIARLFGVYAYAQAFVVAFKIPNLLRDFLGEGATNAVFVPVFTEYRIKHTKEEFWELANVVLNLLLVTLAVITLLGIVFSPLIVRIIAPGFIADPEKLSLTIKLNQIIFPYIILVSLAAYSMGILNSLRHFTIPAFAPCLLNISIIIFALIFGEGIKGLSLGVLIGGILQLLVQIPVLYSKGFRLSLFKKFRHPQALVIGKLMLPRVFSSSVYQLNNFVDSIFGSLAWIVGEGGVAILYFAYRLILFPLGIFSTALSQAILPTLSAQALQDDSSRLKQTFVFGLRANFFVTLPASIALMVLSQPIIETLFAGGKFDAYSAQATSSALFFYAIGLFAYGGIKILQSCFFALKDTLTPAKIAALALAMNIILNFLLMFPLKIAGLALATSLSGIVAFLVLFFKLKKRLFFLGTPAMVIAFLRTLCASLSMGGVCFIVSKKGLIVGSCGWYKFINLGLLVILGLASYVVFCLIFRVREIKDLWGWLRRKQT